MPKLSLVGVSKTYHPRGGQPVEAVRDVSLEVAVGEFMVLVGASGCGKSTLLNLMAGFERPGAGDILLDGKPVRGPGPDRMMLFQDNALFPWLNVIQNVEFGLRHCPGVGRRERTERARGFLAMLQLSAFEASRVHELSGGMKQRVALARALVTEPEVLLFDEPLASLDALTRERFYAQIQDISARTRTTSVFVTHNVREAACLGDRVVVLTERPARIKRIIPVPLARPRDFYDPQVSTLARHTLDVLREGGEAEEGGGLRVEGGGGDEERLRV